MYKVSTQQLVDELFDRLDDSLYAPEARADVYMQCLSGGQKEMLYDVLRAVRKRCNGKW